MPISGSANAITEESIAVSIASEPSVFSPLSIGSTRDASDLDSDREPKKAHRVRSLKSRRLAGRSAASGESYGLAPTWVAQDNDNDNTASHPHATHLVNQISAWLKHEKSKHVVRKAKRAEAHAAAKHSRHTSDDEGPDLDRLEQILKDSFPYDRHHRRESHTTKRPSLRKLLHKPSPSIHPSSDTDYFEGEPIVPNVEAWLDNRQVHAPAPAPGSDDSTIQRDIRAREEAWAAFKYEIVRLTHTLRLKGWRRVTMEQSGGIRVERLSGALTNAVYFVNPPEIISKGTDGQASTQRRPLRLLLRIYGPQVEHLIDREAELEILKRLARKKIGPRLLGTFTNGRFEEYLHALPLTPKELRTPTVSEQIAKRMRELHDGIELLDTEREEGPFLWLNWDKWLQRVEEVVQWLDARVASASDAEQGYVCGTRWELFRSTVDKYRAWLQEQSGGPDHLRDELVFAHNDTQYGNILRITPSGTSPLLLPANSHKQLVVIDFEYANQNTPGHEFANHFSEWCYNYHDEKYSWRCDASLYPTLEEQKRFLRAYTQHVPDFESQTPRMTPLDTPGKEPEALADGRPSVPGRRESESSSIRSAGPSNSIANFLLDARSAPSSASRTIPLASPNISAADDPLSRGLSAKQEAYITDMIRQIRIWRTACSAQWVAWGIVQAKVPGMPGPASPVVSTTSSPRIADIESRLDDAKLETIQASKDETALDDQEIQVENKIETEEEGFDYLSYARDRAMFFWGDMVGLGLVKASDLPVDVQRDMKTLDY